MTVLKYKRPEQVIAHLPGLATTISRIRRNMTARLIIPIGTRFSRLVVLAPAGSSKKGLQLLECLCDCGKTIIALACRLKEKRKPLRSCGCFRRDTSKAINLKHGMSHTPEHRAWKAMKKRCGNINGRDYHRYGGRGIRVYDGWLDDFAAFYGYVGPRPSAQHSIDRYPDNDGNYEPGNVRWATRSEQCSNRRSNHIIEFHGERKTLKEWALSKGLSTGTLGYRIEKWTIEEALTRALTVQVSRR